MQTDATAPFSKLNPPGHGNVGQNSRFSGVERGNRAFSLPIRNCEPRLLVAVWKDTDRLDLEKEREAEGNKEERKKTVTYSRVGCKQETRIGGNVLIHLLIPYFRTIESIFGTAWQTDRDYVCEEPTIPVCLRTCFVPEGNEIPRSWLHQAKFPAYVLAASRARGM